MEKKTLLIIVGIFAVIIIAVFGLRLYDDSQIAITGPVDQEMAETADVLESQVDRSTPEDVVTAFMDNFIASAPPATDEESLQIALSLLSEGAKAEIRGNPMSGDLARIVGVQDTPTEYKIGEVVYKDNPATGEENALAEVEVVLEYSGGGSPRLFLLSKTDNYWQIDGVMPVEN